MEKKEDIRQFNAVIFDMDGVITKTASVHAKAWKQLFDDFLSRYSSEKGLEFREFDVKNDYHEYVDGKPRLDGIRSFLASRGIELPAGDPQDNQPNTVYALGQLKNRIFNETVQKDGVEVYPDAEKMLRQWRSLGLKTAIVTSSRNCRMIIDKSGLGDLFDVRVDGVISEQLGLEGKPAPDIFLEAARKLDLPPEQCVVFEDAISGVQAGRAGRFGLVVGVARTVSEQKLAENGADIVVRELTELR